MAAVVNGGEVKRKLLKISEGTELEVEINTPNAEIYVVVSGMSVMPLTVRFEKEE